MTQATIEQPSTPPPQPLPLTTIPVGTIQIVPTTTTTDSAPVVTQTGPQAPQPELNVASVITSAEASGTVTEHETTSVGGDIVFRDGNAADTHRPP